MKTLHMHTVRVKEGSEAEGREEKSGSSSGTNCGHLQTRHQSGTGNLS